MRRSTLMAWNAGENGNGAAEGHTAVPTEPDTSDLPAGVSLRDDGAWVLERNEPVQGGILRIAQEAPAEALDPARHEGSGVAQVQRAIFNELVRYDANGEVVPHLAESLETDDEGATWELKLRAGVNFTDGTPYDAAAVIAH